MRKIIFSLVLMICALELSAQTYKVVHISGGECLVDYGKGWEKLCINSTLTKNAILKNTSKPLSEVVLRETGTQNTYTVYMLSEQFNLTRFVSDKAKDKPTGDFKNFSGFVKDMVNASKAVMVNVRYDRDGTTHRDVSVSTVHDADDFIRCIVEKAGGSMLDFSTINNISSGLMVATDYDGGNIILTNYGNKNVHCYLLALKGEFLDPEPAIGNNYIILNANSETILPYTKQNGDKIAVIASEDTTNFSMHILLEAIMPMMEKHEHAIPAPKNRVPFSINIL